MEHERKGKGRTLVLLSPKPPKKLVDALATKFDVLVFTVTGDVTRQLAKALEQLRIERPLLVSHGGASTEVASKRMARGIVIIGAEQPRRADAPQLVVAEADVAKLAAFDAPLS